MYDFDFYRQAAHAFYGELGTWAYDTWAELNTMYFEGRNLPGPITWELTPYGAANGLYWPEQNKIHLHTKFLRTPDEVPKEQAYYVLLHEMIHQRIQQLYGDIRNGGTSHNNKHWVAEVNRIAPLMGLDVKATIITQRRVNGIRTRDWVIDEGYLSNEQLARFPYSVASNVTQSNM